MRAFGMLGAHMQRTLLSSQFRQVRCIVSKSEQLSAIKALREQSGAPISDVKSALVDADWHPDGAMDVLRKKGLAAAGKKASRSAVQGLIGFARDDDSAVLVELNSETDFVSRNEQFTSLLSQIAQAALRQTPKDSSGELDMETLRSAPATEGSAQSVGGALSDLVGTVRENMQLRRAYRLSAENGVVSVYLHAGPAPELGRMGALLALESSGPPLEGEARSSVEELGRHLAMHAVAMKPPYLDRTSVPEAALEAERVLLREQALESGKQPKFVDRIVEGRLAKFYEDQCLLDQKFVMSDKQSVQETLLELSKKLGVELRISGFVRLQCGEGMVTQQTDFASEVAAMAA